MKNVKVTIDQQAVIDGLKKHVSIKSLIYYHLDMDYAQPEFESMTDEQTASAWLGITEITETTKEADDAYS